MRPGNALVAMRDAKPAVMVENLKLRILAARRSSRGAAARRTCRQRSTGY